MKKWLKLAVLGLFLALATPSLAQNAALLPNGQQQFADPNGAPYAGGVVYFYIPNSTTPKATWKDPAQTTLNSNPVVLDSAGRAIIYGVGQYRQVLQDAQGNTIWDQLTEGGGNVNFTQVTVASGSTTDLGLSGSNNVCVNGAQPILSFGNNASLASPLYFVSFCGTPLLKDSSQLLLPGGRDIQTQVNSFLIAEFKGSNTWTVLSYHAPNGQTASWSGGNVSIAGSSTTDLGSTFSNLVTITGAASISGFGSSASLANPLYFVDFSGTSTLVNSGTLILQGGANITTAAGGQALAEYLGSGSWRVLVYNSPSSGGGGGGSAVGALQGSGRNLVTTFLSNTTLTMTADQVVAMTALNGTAYEGASLSTTLNFGSTGANGLDTGAIGASTFYGIYWIFNPSGGGTWAALASLSFTAPTLPSGYTAFGLVAVVPTNGSSQIVAGYNCFGRDVSFQRINIFNGTSSSTSLTSASLTAAVPTIAKTVTGIVGQTTGPSTGMYAVASSSGGSGLQEGPSPNNSSAVSLNGFFVALTFNRLPLLTPQAMYWQEVNGSQLSRLDVTGFSF